MRAVGFVVVLNQRHDLTLGDAFFQRGESGLDGAVVQQMRGFDRGIFFAVLAGAQQADGVIGKAASRMIERIQ